MEVQLEIRYSTLIDAVIDYLPSPIDMPPVKAFDPKTGEHVRDIYPKEDDVFLALAFKIMVDPYIGKLTFARVYSGKLEKEVTLLILLEIQKKEFQDSFLHANKEEVDYIRAGT